LDLVADIGATNARFQLCLNGVLQGEPSILPTQDYQSGSALLADARKSLPTTSLGTALLAVAGPVTSVDQAQITNTGLVIDRADASTVLACETRLVNDFFALAHGVPHFSQLEQLGGEPPLPLTKALLGPGSGLGMATLIRLSQVIAGVTSEWQVLASEGGHADLAPGSHLEAELWGVLMQQHQHVSWETVLSGRGLQHLYAAMCSLWGMQPADLSPADITNLGQDMSDPVCHQTLETFCALLGAAAGNLAVTVAARGGVYIGGGIVSRMLDFVRASQLRRRFEERGAMADFVKPIPIMVVTESEPGLIGAAQCLQVSTLT